MTARAACLFLIAVALPLHANDDTDASDAAPARNWVLPLFTNEGAHSMTLRGDEVHPVGNDRIDVENINIVTFSGDAAARPTSILLSPDASFFPHENRASGPSSVRLILIRDDAEIVGDDWSFDREGEKVSIRHNVHVIFKEPLKDILK